jgi:hypothetical protein
MRAGVVERVSIKAYVAEPAGGRAGRAHNLTLPAIPARAAPDSASRGAVTPYPSDQLANG